MFEEQQTTARFFTAPLSKSAAVAAALEPTVAVGCLLLMHWAFAQPMEGASVALLLLLLVMLFPGANRLGRTGIGVIIDIVLSWSVTVMVLLLIAYATSRYHNLSRPMLTAWVIATPMLQWAATRFATFVMLSRLRQRDAARPAVVIGAGHTGLRVASMLQARQHLGWQMLGFFDDRSPDRLNLPPKVPNHGPVNKLPEFIELEGVQDVFIALPLTSQPRIVQLLEMLQNTTASVHYVPDVFGASVIRGRLEDMGGLPVVSVLISPFTGVNGLLKRLSDIVLSLLILLIIMPVMAVVAAGVKLSSPGPVLFRQLRTGLDGELIHVYKFRSMTTMDNGTVVMQATRGDPRITPFGRFIRKTSLDELPQFLNVLQGRMSIVGPRPHAVAHNDQYRKLVKAYMARHKVKPGITGWAQVNGLRGETDTVEKMQRRVEFDLQYLRNWSLGLDLLIIARTIKQVFFNRDVY